MKNNSITTEERLFNFNLVKVLEDVDEEKAIELLSSEELDKKQLCCLIEDSLLKRVTNLKTNEPVQLSNKVVMAGIRNLFDRITNDFIIKEQENENNNKK